MLRSRQAVALALFVSGCFVEQSGGGNHLPVAVDDSAAVAEDGSVLIDALQNDSDSENHLIVVATVSLPSHGTATIENTVIRYSPGADYNGPDSFQYTIADSDGKAASASISVTVSAVNDAPISM